MPGCHESRSIWLWCMRSWHSGCIHNLYEAVGAGCPFPHHSPHAERVDPGSQASESRKDIVAVPDHFYVHGTAVPPTPSPLEESGNSLACETQLSRWPMSEEASGIPMGFPLAPVTHMATSTCGGESSLVVGQPDKRQRCAIDPHSDPLAAAYTIPWPQRTLFLSSPLRTSQCQRFSS